MKPAKSPKKKLLLPKVRKPMPPPTKVHKGKLRKLDETQLDRAIPDAVQFLGDPFAGDEFSHDIGPFHNNGPFQDNWLFT